MYRCVQEREREHFKLLTHACGTFRDATLLYDSFLRKDMLLQAQTFQTHVYLQLKQIPCIPLHLIFLDKSFVSGR